MRFFISKNLLRGGFLQCQHLTDAISEHSRMTLDYFYGQAGELFSFYRIPKALFQEPRFQSLSTNAKTLYGILLDRMSLSAKNGWLDEQGRVFIIFTIEDVKRALCCADNKATKLLRELEEFGLIERKRRGLGKPSLVYEEQEEGVSGHKVRAEARDKLQIIKEYARKGKFDILLVFMFDRIGRIADETPFVVEWFVRNGIRVWSTQEGEQRFDNHTDKLLNYIRFWQADGESEKTSVRTRTSLRQLVEEGHFKGGSAPYGYDLVKSGRINKRKHELYELHINEQEAEIVRLIFDKYVYEGYGAQRIATYLNNAGYRARSGKCWHPGSLRGMVGNLTYMGVLRCGDARSELMPELQIIPQEEFEAAQRIREDRSAHAAEEAEHHVPLRTRGQALLSNNVYCGHCGARLALTTSRKWRKLSDGTLDDTLRIRYTCYGKLRKQTDCTGQTGYTMHILDEIIDKMVRQIFSRLRGIPKEQLITSRYAKETAERKNHLQTLQAERDKAEKDLLALKTEILAVIKGESAFPKDTLAEMIAAQEKKHTELETLCEEASAELERNAELMANVSQLYEELISYADLYDSASFEAKKMIVSQLIRRVEVYRGYQIHVDFNFDLAQYLENRDELAC